MAGNGSEEYDTALALTYDLSASAVEPLVLNNIECYEEPFRKRRLSWTPSSTKRGCKVRKT